MSVGEAEEFAALLLRWGSNDFLGFNADVHCVVENAEGVGFGGVSALRMDVSKDSPYQ